MDSCSPTPPWTVHFTAGEMGALPAWDMRRDIRRDTLLVAAARADCTQSIHTHPASARRRKSAPCDSGGMAAKMKAHAAAGGCSTCEWAQWQQI